MTHGPVHSLRICRENDIDIAVLSASSAVSSLPVANLQNTDLSKIWRAESLSAWVLAELPQELSLGVTMLANTNLVESDVVRVRASTNDPTALNANAYDSLQFQCSVDPVYGTFIHFVDPPRLVKYLRIDFVSVAAIPEAGRWMSGQAWEPAHHFQFGWEQGRIDHSRRAQSLGQHMFIDRLPRQRIWRFTIRALDAADADEELERLNRVVGSSVDILVCKNRDSTNLARDSIWGLLDEPITYSQMEAIDEFYEASFVIRERI